MDARTLVAYGIEPEYTDIWGREHATSEPVARAILRSLGVGEPDANRARLEEWSRPLDPALVVRDNDDSITLRLPAGRSGESIKLEIRWETGEMEHHPYFLPELTTTGSVTLVDSENITRSFIAKRIPLPALRLGYHDLRIYAVRQPQLEILGEAKFIVCPRRAMAFDQRIAGVALSLYGLRSARNWGCGDFTDLRAAIDAFAPAGAAFIALNPLHAIANRQPYNTSPYLPQCSLYRNFIYLDPEKVGNLEMPDSLRTEIEKLRGSEFVEYEAVARLKLAALQALFPAFLDEGGSPEFDRYVAREGSHLHDFAVYCALDQKIHRDNPNLWLWTDWPEPYRDPRSPEVARFAQEHSREVLFYEFLQWHIDRQLADVQAYARDKGMSIGLYHDLALATDRFGSDLWANRPFYAAGCRVGAPPDDFSPKGQDWAFPPPSREAHRRDGYRLFAQSIRNNARHGGALRIDHVMRFFRLYWIPDQMEAADGAYVRDYAEDLLGVLALESARGKFIVIGEDLGTVTGEVRHALAQAGLLSYRVLWFERNPDGSFRKPEEYPAQAAASSTTHDLPTLAGFFASRDIHARRAAGLIEEAEYQRQLAARREEIERLEQALKDAGFAGDPIGFLLSTPSAVAVVNQEDLTGETEQQNLPGSTWQHPNWRRKMKVSVEDLAPLAERFRAAVARSGRARP
ncbi:MAG TPA: 4-alpha-glucanotransferase [Bryobacteraceae bacterium]|nr:4-alpha-glucanotransferase [Bryobacteraceae bacterium]